MREIEQRKQIILIENKIFTELTIHIDGTH